MQVADAKKTFHCFTIQDYLALPQGGSKGRNASYSVVQAGSSLHYNPDLLAGWIWLMHVVTPRCQEVQ